VSNGQILDSVTNLPEIIHDLHFNSNGDRLYSLGVDGTIREWASLVR
jgi:hypothetical protein